MPGAEDGTRSLPRERADRLIFRDASDLVDLLRMGRLPEGWIAPPAVRELREMVRHRAKMVAWRSGLKASVHGVLAKLRRLPQRARRCLPSCKALPLKAAKRAPR